jgi:Flp pilus assembly protein TadG
MGSRKSALKEERGVTLVLMALMVFLALGMSALAIDYGMVKSIKAEAQRAMDAAALAGASVYIISDPSLDHFQAAKDTAWKYAQLHTVGKVQVLKDEVTPVPDLANNKITVSFARSGIKTWFANIFGTSSFGITALAAAHVEETGSATCVKPVAIPDIWNNAPNLVAPPGGGKKPPPAVESEDLNGNHLWDFKDQNGNGIWDAGETEPWVFNSGTDTYSPTTTGYGTTARDPYGSGALQKTDDYGRQIVLMTFSPADNVVSSMYYSWAPTQAQTAADSVAELLRGNRCAAATVSTSYPAANGGKIGQTEDGWQGLINQDPRARWNDQTNSVENSSSSGNWLNDSPRVIVVGLYDPSKFANRPNANDIQFVNLAKVWVDQRPCGGGPPGQCKQPITGRFLGYVNGTGSPGTTTGSLVWRLVLIK